MDSPIARRVRLQKGPSSDRRASVRYPLNLEVRYSVAGRRGALETGSGHTIDMSSSGLSFTADKPLPIGQGLGLSIDWPARLDGDVQIQLIVSGVVVRHLVALKLHDHYHRYLDASRSVGCQAESNPLKSYV
jgi:hypothetical protein